MKRKTLLRAVRDPAGVAVEFVLRDARLLDHREVHRGRRQSTKAVFKLHAYSTTADKAYQFVVVGVPDNNDLKVGNGTKWGTNGTSRRTIRDVEPASSGTPLSDASGQCSDSGFDFSSVTGVTWKGFMTPNKVADKGKVNTEVIVQSGVEGYSWSRGRLPDLCSASLAKWIR